MESYFKSLDSIDGELATINLGPTHPATHGIFQNVLKMDSERIISQLRAEGYVMTVVNGKVIRENDEPVGGVLPGRLLRGPQAPQDALAEAAE